MYWLKSVFSINSFDDIKFLADLYNNVSGELEIRQPDDENIFIERTLNPFNKIFSLDSLKYPFEIYSRLAGPDTIKAVSVPVNKIDITNFVHSNKNLIIEWSSYIDNLVSSEMDRTNDIGYIFQMPDKFLENMSELLLAFQVSKYATLMIPSDSGFEIYSRLAGPDTIKAVSVPVNKIDITNFVHSNKNLIIEWSSYIDNLVSSEIGRTNDIGYIFETPDKFLENMSELLLAVQVSKYATLMIPSDSGFIISNPQSTYLSSVGLNKKFVMPSLQFDKDDGFCSVWGDKSEHEDYLNSRFKLWKENGYQGKLSNYYN